MQNMLRASRGDKGKKIYIYSIAWAVYIEPKQFKRKKERKKKNRREECLEALLDSLQSNGRVYGEMDHL